MYILSFDIGTSGLKTAVTGEDGQIVLSETGRYPTYHLESGGVEQSPEDWWAAAVDCCSTLRERAPHIWRQIGVIGVCGHMIGLVCVDKQGHALRPAFIHADTRSKAQLSHVLDTVGGETLYRITGNLPDTRSPLCKLLFIKDHEPDTYKRTAKFLQSKDYLSARLTGNIDNTDYSDASHAQLMDIEKKTPAHELFYELSIDSSLLPAVRSGQEAAGSLTAESAAALGLPAGTPVAVGGGDGGCGAIGAGAVREGTRYMCLGTTAWIMSMQKKPYFDQQMRSFSLLSPTGELCGVLGTTQCAGRAVEFTRSLLGCGIDELETLAKAVPPGCDGLTFLPYLEGERTPVYDSDARGVFFGISPSHTKAHFIRATLEGVSMSLRTINDILGQPDEPINTIGGGANSPLWCSIIADMLGCPIATVNVPQDDATSLGAAVLAGVLAGMFTDIADGTKRITRTNVFIPQGRECYKESYRVFSGLYPALCGLYKRG